jgi:hypothetical protein
VEKLAFYLSWLTIVALNAIVFLVASSNGQIIGHSPSFGLLVNGIVRSFISSSMLIGYLNWQKQQKIRALLFWANILMVLIPTILNVAGLRTPTQALLILLDLYWLNQYLLYTVGKPSRGIHD